MGYKKKKKKKNSTRSLGNMEDKKRGEKRSGSRESAKRSVRCSAQSNPLLFIQ